MSKTTLLPSLFISSCLLFTPELIATSALSRSIEDDISASSPKSRSRTRARTSASETRPKERSKSEKSRVISLDFSQSKPSKQTMIAELNLVLERRNKTKGESLDKEKDEERETQVAQKDFPPKILNSKQLQEIINAVYRLNKKGDVSKEAKPQTYVAIDQNTSACIITTPSKLQCLSIALQLEYINVNQNKELAKSKAWKLYNKSEIINASEIIIDPSITAVRGEPVGSYSSNPNEKMSTYKYKLMMNNQKIVNFPLIISGESGIQLTTFDETFQFMEQQPSDSF
jgi:hypothetical protein